MGPEFHQTVMGKKFFEVQLPNLIKSLNRLADLKEEELNLVKKPKLKITCSDCGKNIDVEWDTKTQGFLVFCHHCGAKNLLCDECQEEGDDGSKPESCDYDKISNTCHNNPPLTACTFCDWCKDKK
jgi:DNA-directed RNA polymerase subunit RPC12/RpoP